jgi:hypothetical protein
MLPAKDAATSVMRAVFAAQPDTPAKIECAWRIAAGPALARATTVSWTPDGVLVVHARSAAWRDEVVRARPTIAARLGYLVGPATISTIRVTEDSTCEMPSSSARSGRPRGSSSAR